MDTYAVYLKPRSSFITWPTSDTLFGALCWAIYHLYGKKRLEEEIIKFRKSPKFILSSAFPFFEKNGTVVHFFPKPFLRELKSNDVEIMTKDRVGNTLKEESLKFKREIVSINERLKELKKVGYVSESIFSEIVEGSLNLKGIFQRFREAGTSEDDIEKLGNTLITFNERNKIDPDKELKVLFNESDVMRNQVDRVAFSTVEGALFHKKEIFLHKNYGGLWFLVKTQEIEFLAPLFRYLGDTGIGGKRTSGKGHFDITWTKRPNILPEAKNPDSFIILSRWFPDESERNFGGGFASWNLLTLRSKRETMYPEGGERILKDLLRVFSEGSIFSLKEKKEYYGRIVTAGNMGTYTAYHNGVALPAFIKFGEIG